MVNIMKKNDNKDIDFIGLGNNIAERREELNYNQSDLSELLGVSTTTISLWETGKKKPSLKNLIHLCNALECDLDYLLGKADYSTKEIETVCEYTGLSENAAKELHKMKSDNDSVIHALNNLIEKHKDAFIGIIDNIHSYCINLLIHDFLNASKREKKLQEHHIKESSLALMNCQQWISYIGHNASSDKYYKTSITPYLNRIMKDDNNS